MADKNKIEVVLALLDKATKPLQAFNKRIEAIQEPVRKVNNKLVLFGKEAGFGKLRDAAGGVATAVGDVANEVGALAKKIAVGVGIVGGSLFALVKMTADAGDGFDEMSRKAGVSAEFFQKAAYAASFASVSQEDLTGALGKMNANIVSAITGSKQMQVWFRRIGLTTADLRKMKPEQVFERVIAEVKKLPPESAKAGALMRAIFGKSGANLLPMVDGFKELTEEAERLGLVLSEEDINAGAEFNDTFDKMMKVLKGVGMMIGSLLMPYFKEAIAAVTEWTLANRDLIKSKVAEWIARLRDNWPEIREGALAAWAAIKKIADMAAGFVERVGGMGNALAIVAAVVAGPLLAALASLTLAVVQLGIAFALTPFGWIAAAIAGLIVVGLLLWANWKKITAGLSEAFATMSASASAAVGAIQDVFSGMWQRVKTMFADGVQYIKDQLSKLNPFAAAGKAFEWGKSLFAPSGAAAGTPGGQQAPAAASALSMGPPAGVAPLAAASAAPVPPQTITQNAKVEVDFKNVPRGTEVRTPNSNKAPVDLSMGYAMQTI